MQRCITYAIKNTCKKKLNLYGNYEECLSFFLNRKMMNIRTWGKSNLKFYFLCVITVVELIEFTITCDIIFLLVKIGANIFTTKQTFIYFERKDN